LQFVIDQEKLFKGGTLIVENVKKPMTTTDKKIDSFLSQYEEQIFQNALALRQLLLANLPDIIEQVDIKAKMIAYCYGQKYTELLCVIIPSKKGLKLGFNRGNELPDPNKLLSGTGKISRYVEIKEAKQIKSVAVKKLVLSALKAYRQRMKTIIAKNETLKKTQIR
jgi:hypothetical protein